MTTTNTTTEIFWIKSDKGILHGSDSTLESFVLNKLVGLLETGPDKSWRLGWGSVSDFKNAIEELGYC